VRFAADSVRVFRVIRRGSFLCVSVISVPLRSSSGEMMRRLKQVMKEPGLSDVTIKR